MRKLLMAVMVSAVLAVTASAQTALTVDQRVTDFNQLASYYAKNYAPYEWKAGAIGFDLLNLTSWQPGVHKAKTTDLDFQELLIEYVASLNDAHDYIAFPTTFYAWLPLSVDIYDGKVLIDGINTSLLPKAQFPFNIGDELVSIDGQTAQKAIESLRKYSIAANQRSTDRVAAAAIVNRNQQIMPHLYQLGDASTVVIRSNNVDNTYVIPWQKNGIPVTSQGPVPSPKPGRPHFMSDEIEGFTPAAGYAADSPFFRKTEGVLKDEMLPSYMEPILPLMNASVSSKFYAVSGMGSRFPVFAAGLLFNPSLGFVLRRGFSSSDFIFSGTYSSNGVRIGFIRIPTMSPSSTSLAFQQIEEEINYFNQNTDGLVIDVMRNPGGVVSFVESLSQRFMTDPFQTIGFEIRATAAWVYSFAAQLLNAMQSGASPEIIANLQNNYNEVLKAYQENRGRSTPVSLNSTGSLMLQPAPVHYNKPLMVLTDEFSASGADMFPAIIQDNHRGPIFGMRSMGAGGSVSGYQAMAFTEAYFRVTASLMNRGHIIQTDDYPPAPYIENIGVRPDIVCDYMTLLNLLNQGKPYIQAFTEAIVDHIQNTAP